MQKISKNDLYQKIVTILQKKNITCTDPKEIQYGLQFEIQVAAERGVIRIYESKKGTRYDLSQLKKPELRNTIESYLTSLDSNLINQSTTTTKDNQEIFLQDPLPIIGTDESGKGDYFGPLTIAGVYVDENTASKLKVIGVADSKTLSDNRIFVLAQKIQELCPHSCIIIGNKRYNEMYDKFKNLNKLLAWGHGKVIENVLDQVACEHVLTDQFGDPSLVKEALQTKGKTVQLNQRPKAEANIAVAAASILARAAFASKIIHMEKLYKIKIPKGASDIVVKTAQAFIKIEGQEKLSAIAKLHFVITRKVLQY